MLIQDIPTIPVLNGNNPIYAWIITILILFIIGIVVYFRSEIKALREELKLEREYIKQESIKNMLTLSDVNNILTNLVDNSEKSLDNTNEMKPLIKTNSHRLETIKDYVIKIRRNNGREEH